ncbi:hypothetical protein CENSYa_1122 [Cenarchaeum symbiosum A]|uniref:C2H2-type domain-containing protein n=1 Tax=Cenarchaeum symbiosum (strain A) TaxID=414004 RepID=A0RWN4_CENSY|nr:hypothetical protein CENSYa_1122 [Cenarchaeum symbiosum A]
MISTVLYLMLKCEYCTKYFEDTRDGLIEKTFHVLLHPTNLLNRR